MRVITVDLEVKEDYDNSSKDAPYLTISNSFSGFIYELKLDYDLYKQFIKKTAESDIIPVVNNDQIMLVWKKREDKESNNETSAVKDA